MNVDENIPSSYLSSRRSISFAVMYISCLSTYSITVMTCTLDPATFGDIYIYINVRIPLSSDMAIRELAGIVFSLVVPALVLPL